ncbi:MAG: hypothetical protein ACRDZ7_07940 [Acidimicrobiia bacterium]
MMLEITTRAAAFIDEARTQRQLPEHYGIRIFGGAQANGQGRVQMGFSERPLAGDDITEAEGTRLFVAPEVTPVIDGLVLDVQEDGERVGLVLRKDT